MSQELDHLKPGAPAPATGTYEEHNVFGTRTGNRVDVNEGDPMPPAARGFTWRRVQSSSD
jgi:hypothetical protein